MWLIILMNGQSKYFQHHARVYKISYNWMYILKKIQLHNTNMVNKCFYSIVFFFVYYGWFFFSMENKSFYIFYLLSKHNTKSIHIIFWKYAFAFCKFSKLNFFSFFSYIIFKFRHFWTNMAVVTKWRFITYK